MATFTQQCTYQECHPGDHYVYYRPLFIVDIPSCGRLEVLSFTGALEVGTTESNLCRSNNGARNKTQGLLSLVESSKHWMISQWLIATHVMWCFASDFHDARYCPSCNGLLNIMLAPEAEMSSASFLSVIVMDRWRDHGQRLYEPIPFVGSRLADILAL